MPEPRDPQRFTRTLPILCLMLISLALIHSGCQHNRERREIFILMSMTEPEMTKLLTEELREGIGKKYRLQITEIPEVDKLLDHAKRRQVDIFVLFLNNMLFSKDIPFSPVRRMEKALDVVSFLKATYGKPVIAMSAWRDDPAMGEKAKRAGSTYYFQLPLDIGPFIQAVENSINMLPED